MTCIEDMHRGRMFGAWRSFAEFTDLTVAPEAMGPPRALSRHVIAKELAKCITIICETHLRQPCKRRCADHLIDAGRAPLAACVAMSARIAPTRTMLPPEWKQGAP